MARLWEIRESYGDRRGRYGNKTMEEMTPEEQEAYKMGWEDCMEEMEGGDESQAMGNRYGNRYGSREGMREGCRMGERRSRDSMGRYR